MSRRWPAVHAGKIGGSATQSHEHVCETVQQKVWKSRHMVERCRAVVLLTEAGRVSDAIASIALECSSRYEAHPVRVRAAMDRSLQACVMRSAADRESGRCLKEIECMFRHSGAQLGMRTISLARRSPVRNVTHRTICVMRTSCMRLPVAMALSIGCRKKLRKPSRPVWKRLHSPRQPVDRWRKL